MEDFEHPNLLPILQLSSWNGRKSAVTRCLSGSAKVGESMPLLVSYGVVGENQNKYATIQSLSQLENGLVELDKRSKKNWAQHCKGQRWEKVDHASANIYAWGGNHEISSSALLFKPVLRSIHKKLGREEIYISTPHRFMIIASDNASTLGKLSASIYQECKNDGGPYLSPTVLQVKNERIVGPSKNSVAELAAFTVNTANKLVDEVLLAERIAKSLAATFILIAAADGDIDEKEIAAFLGTLMTLLESTPLHEEVQAGLRGFVDNPQFVITQLITEHGEYGAQLDYLTETCDKFSDEYGQNDANILRALLLLAAQKTAEASGGGLLGIGSKIDKDEARMLELLKQALQPSGQQNWSRSSVLMKDAGKRVLRTALSCENMNELEVAIAWEIDAWSSDVEKLSAMDGEIRLEIDPSRFRVTGTTRRRLADNIDKINALAKASNFKTPAGAQVFVTAKFVKR